ncbi:DUF2723 domain-containing protein [Flavobacteriaceae bacterium LSUCC0859]|nr:DUF2723 domain-containing protein [Flavobacteriaceae bacterium LSUCC0859]
MFAKDFALWDRRLGWACFFIALTTYALTVEPTGSFWDAGEYIATAAKLQIGHPPGAPLLQMIGAFFAMFALEPTQIARMVNYVSGVSSAFTILFMFWTLTNLLRKLIGSSKEMTNAQAIAILGSGIVGALAFTYSDSFWFNAVETEVYAMASLIMALLLWMGLKWTDHIEEPRGDRWLIAISFVVGLTFGIQFMGFLAIPSVGLLYFFKKYKTTTVKNFLVANILVVTLLMLVYKFSLTYVLQLFGWSEVFFVNNFGLPFNSGSIIMGLVFIGVFYYALKYTRSKNLVGANTVVLSLMFLILGFSSWLMLPIRANAGVIINENDPSDARSLLAYYNREQYPGVDSPFYGAYFSNAFSGTAIDKDDKPKYEKDEKTGTYVIVNNYKGALQGSDPKHMGLLPRMWSEQHAENYMRYYGPLEFRIKSEYLGSEELKTTVGQFKNGLAKGEIDEAGYISFLREFRDYIEVLPPSILDNIRYMIDFQFNYMYWRYFMWNFSGKQDDIQGRYDNHGNWISGFSFIDNPRLGPQENLPSDIKNNKGRNTYYLLPFLLGLIGIIFQFRKDRKQFWVLLVFFLFTGLAIQFYTNPYIFQPRERDYSLVGSFYIFALWIGLGVYGLYDELSGFIKKNWLSPIVVAACFLAVPVLMGFQNWDDHDRSNRRTAQSTAKAYLNSTQKDAGAILFTIGDNDTFPLWYAQEIEGYRTDVRVINTSLFATDWYIDQMKRKAYSSDPIPSQLTHDLYHYGSRDAIYFQEVTDKRWDIKDFISWVGSDKPQTKFKYLLGAQGADLSQYSDANLDIVYYPTNKIRVPVNKENVLASGLVKAKDSALIVDYIDIDLPRSALPKNRLLMLDLLANNDWKRPIYFSGGSFEAGEYLWLKDYLQLDGLVYKLVPIKTKYESVFEMGRIDTELMAEIVKSWDWGNAGDPDVYLDTQTRIQGLSFRSNIARLIETQIAENKLSEAKEILDLTMENLPVKGFDYYNFVVPFIEGYYAVGATQEARAIFYELKTIYQEHLNYYAFMDVASQYDHIQDIIENLEGYRRILDVLSAGDQQEVTQRERDEFEGFMDKFSHFYEGMETQPTADPDLPLEGLEVVPLEN